MPDKNRSTHSERKYPQLYEKTIPIIIGILALIIFVMLIYTIAVGVGILNFG
jgi:hypothetical protein